MKSLRKIKFGDLYLIPSRNGLSRPERVRGSGFKMINMGEIFQYDRIGDIPMELVPMSHREVVDMCIEEGDLLFARQSLVLSGAGKVSIVTRVQEKTTFESHIIRVRLDKNKAESLFYYYYFKSPYSGMRAIVQQCAQSGIRGSDLQKLLVSYPKLETQKGIADIIDQYDQLLDTNRRRIQLLEESARLLFREWFVYFKFPDHEKVKIVDGMPEGWKKTILGSIANRIKKNYSINDEDLSLIDLARINSRTLAVTDVGVASDLETARIIFEKDDILFSSIRPYLHKVVLAPFKGITNTSVFVIRAKNPIYRTYITLLLFSDYAIQFANQHSTGTKMPVVKWNSVSMIPALIPPKAIMDEFQSIAGPMLEQIQLSYFQNQKLSQARDLLLPRLMSGAIEV
jgi:type I restriction enzyme, S subunit